MPVAFNFAPKYWALCNGQLLSVRNNQALFSLIGVEFGGDGTQTFGLPDLRGRTPRGVSAGPGPMNGTERASLTAAQMPAHIHMLVTASGSGVSSRTPTTPAGKLLATDPIPTKTMYGQPTSPVALMDNNILPAGGSQDHPNMQPSLVLNYIIALTGIYPSRP